MMILILYPDTVDNLGKGIVPAPVGKILVLFSSPCAKVCNAHSYKSAQCSRELNRIHRDIETLGSLGFLWIHH